MDELVIHRKINNNKNTIRRECHTFREQEIQLIAYLISSNIKLSKLTLWITNM